MSRYYNIIEAMEKNYGYSIGDELREYVQSSPNAIRSVSQKPDACGFRLVDWEVKGSILCGKQSRPHHPKGCL